MSSADAITVHESPASRAAFTASRSSLFSSSDPLTGSQDPPEVHGIAGRMHRWVELIEPSHLHGISVHATSAV